MSSSLKALLCEAVLTFEYGIVNVSQRRAVVEYVSVRR
jgi:hypothetical protein